MKRKLILFGLLMVVLIAGGIMLLPKQITIQLAVPVNANYNVVYRSLLTNKLLVENGNDVHTDAGNKILQTAQSVRYTVFAGNTNGIAITIHHKNLSLKSNLKIVPLLQDSMLVMWSAELPYTTNGFKKVTHFLQSGAVEKDMLEQLTQLKKRTENVKEVYGLNIVRKRMKYDNLIAWRTTVEAYPDIAFIYAGISELQKYIAQQEGKEEDKPLLHISETDSHAFELTVAIPVDKKLPDNEMYKAKQMMPGYVLEAKVTGGEEAVKQAFKSVKNFIDDYGLSTPAIPFELLATNRMKEINTDNWITYIYFPVY